MAYKMNEKRKNRFNAQKCEKVTWKSQKNKIKKGCQ